MTAPEQNAMRVKPILLLEINEVPWRLVDRFRSHSGLPHLRQFFDGAETYTTTTVDSGHLSPWVTWPTLHRGIDNDEHGIKNLGQDPKTFKGTPIWAEYRKRGHSIGVCGSLQSWPPMDPGEGGFYIPDTFAHDERCIPDFIEPFQKFNLGQVRKNGRTIDASSLVSSELPRFLLFLPKLGIRPQTLAKVTQQLVFERIRPTFIARRPSFQSMLLWDVFVSLYQPKHPPAFSTFFTNHVASTMHRYWHHSFPEDFGSRFESEPKSHYGTMIFALKLLDQILAEAMRFLEKNPEIQIVFASSMGQAAVHHDGFEGYAASINDIPKLMRACGLQDSEFKQLLAMVPQVAVGVPDLKMRSSLVQKLGACRTESGEKLFFPEEISGSVSISIATPSKKDILAEGFRLDNAFIRWEEAGIRMNEVEPGTAYHIPEGILAFYGKDFSASDRRTQTRADEVKKLLMSRAGLS